MSILITAVVFFIIGLSLNFKTKKEIKIHNLKGKYKFTEKFDYFVIKEYDNNTFKLEYYNKPYSEDFSE